MISHSYQNYSPSYCQRGKRIPILLRSVSDTLAPLSSPPAIQKASCRTLQHLPTKPVLLDFKLKILDLTSWTENSRETSPILTSTLQLLKYSRRPELIGLLKDIFERWRDSLVSQSFKEWLQAAWSYVMSTNQDLSETQVQEIVAELLSVEYEPGSLVDRLYRQGHSEGLTKGHAEGIAEGLAKGLANGTERGIVIGRIQLLQQLLGLAISSNDDLVQLKLPQVRDLAASLEQRLKDKST